MKYTIKNDYIEAVIKDDGAELCSLKRSGDSVEYMWQGDPKFWNRHAPVLFPIVGKLHNNKCYYNGQTYQMTQHGFARDQKFTVKEQTENFISFSFCSTAETRTKYPFDFELILSYKLNNNKLEVIYEVINETDGEMLFSIGAHPAFNWPLDDGAKEEYFFEFDNLTELEALPLTADGISNNKVPVKMESNRIPLSEQTFENDAIILNNPDVKSVTFRNSKSSRFVKMNFAGFPYLGLWSKPEGAPFICIEPWYGIADFEGHNQQLKDKRGIIKLDKDENFHASYEIEI
jgi:galactose mutarotase-like enzyme